MEESSFFVSKIRDLEKENEKLRSEIEKLKSDVATRDDFINKLLDVLKTREIRMPPTSFPPAIPPYVKPMAPPITTAGGGMTTTTPDKNLKVMQQPDGYA